MHKNVGKKTRREETVWETKMYGGGEENNIKIIPEEIRYGGLDWIILTQDKTHWYSLFEYTKGQ